MTQTLADILSDTWANGSRITPVQRSVDMSLRFVLVSSSLADGSFDFTHASGYTPTETKSYIINL